MRLQKNWGKKCLNEETNFSRHLFNKQNLFVFTYSIISSIIMLRLDATHYFASGSTCEVLKISSVKNVQNTGNQENQIVYLLI